MAPMLSRGMTGYLGMDLPRFLALVRARRWLIVGIVVCAAGLTLVWSLPQPSRIRASADLLFGHTTSADSIITGRRHRHDRRPGADGGDEPRARLARHRGDERQAAVPGSGDAPRISRTP